MIALCRVPEREPAPRVYRGGEPGGARPGELVFRAEELAGPNSKMPVAPKPTPGARTSSRIWPMGVSTVTCPKPPVAADTA